MPPNLSPEAQSAYFFELDHMLDRVESASNHYHVLELGRTATSDEIRAAYLRLMRMHPKSRELALEPALEERVERGFAKVAKAFAVLSNLGKRAAYDNGLRRNVPGATWRPVVAPPGAASAPSAAAAAAAPAPKDFRVTAPPAPPAPGVAAPPPTTAAGTVTVARERASGIHFRYSAQSDGENRRRSERLAMRLPARVTGYDRTGRKWSEVAHTVDISALGLALHLKESVDVGNVVHVLAPVPVRMRAHGIADASYSVYALVQRVEPADGTARLVGLEFWGEKPPTGYRDSPWTRYKVRWTDRSRRREPRRQLREEAAIEFLDRDSAVVGDSSGMIENASRGGARVVLVETPPETDFVRLLAADRGFESRAVVRRRFVGRDGHTRLCLQFTDAPFPE